MRRPEPALSGGTGAARRGWVGSRRLRPPQSGPSGEPHSTRCATPVPAVRPLPGSRRPRSVWTAPARAGAVCQAWVDLSAWARWLAAAPSIGKAVPRGTALHTLRESRHKAQEGAPAYGLRRPEPALSVGHGGSAPVQVVGLQRLCPPAKRSLGEPHSTRCATSSMSFWRSRPGHPLLGPSAHQDFSRNPGANGRGIPLL